MRDNNLVDALMHCAAVNAKTKAARRSVQRRNDAVNATIDKAKTARGAVDYSKPVKPAKSELWDD